MWHYKRIDDSKYFKEITKEFSRINKQPTVTPNEFPFTYQDHSKTQVYMTTLRLNLSNWLQKLDQDTNILVSDFCAISISRMVLDISHPTSNNQPHLNSYLTRRSSSCNFPDFSFSTTIRNSTSLPILLGNVLPLHQLPGLFVVSSLQPLSHPISATPISSRHENHKMIMHWCNRLLREVLIYTKPGFHPNIRGTNLILCSEWVSPLSRPPPWALIFNACSSQVHREI